MQHQEEQSLTKSVCACEREIERQREIEIDRGGVEISEQRSNYSSSTTALCALFTVTLSITPSIH